MIIVQISYLMKTKFPHLIIFVSAIQKIDMKKEQRKIHIKKKIFFCFFQNSMLSMKPFDFTFKKIKLLFFFFPVFNSKRSATSAHLKNQTLNCLIRWLKKKTFQISSQRFSKIYRFLFWMDSILGTINEEIIISLLISMYIYLFMYFFTFICLFTLTRFVYLSIPL